MRYWSRAKRWSVSEAGYLIAGLDPDRAKQRLVSSSYGLSQDLNYRVATLLEQELGAHSFDATFSPIEIFAAADLLELKVPERLRTETERIDAKRRAVDKGVSPDAGRVPQISPRSHNAESEDDEHTLSTREQNSLLKILLGMAIANYKHDPRAGRNSTAPEIAKDMETIGMSIDPDTVRKWLRAAAEFAPDPEFLDE